MNVSDPKINDKGVFIGRFDHTTCRKGSFNQSNDSVAIWCNTAIRGLDEFEKNGCYRYKMRSKKTSKDLKDFLPSDLKGFMFILKTLGGGNSHIFGIFTPILGEDEPILTNIFQLGWNHQLEKSASLKKKDDFFVLWWFPFDFGRQIVEEICFPTISEATVTKGAAFNLKAAMQHQDRDALEVEVD